jgi:hypothetical protein
MAGRGGRGGGRGRGGGTGGSRDLFRDTLEDLGLNHQEVEAGGQPLPLYPPIELPRAPELVDKDIKMVQNLRELDLRIQNSPFHLSRPKITKDIVRYSDRYNPSKLAPTETLASCLTGALSKTGDGAYLPEELVGNRKTGGRKGGAQAKTFISSKNFDLAFSILEAREKKGEEEAKENEDEQDASADSQELDEEIDDEDDDYAKDHYMSGDDSSGGGDDEPVF